jgi:uncharacterized damage-inducible protein DinB
MLVGMHPHLHDVFSRLDQSRAALAAAVDTIAPPLRQQRPEADRWSAAEVLEHLSIVERIFTGRVADAITAARAGGLAPEAGGRSPLPEAIETRMADRVNKRSAPDAARPTGTLDAAAAWKALEDGHHRLRALVADVDGLALSQVSIEHHVFGAMTVYQLVELIAAHEARHTEQIRELSRALATSSKPLSVDAARPALRHLVATLAYRAAKVLRDVPPDFGTASFGAATRQPVLVVAHLADLMTWAISLAQGQYVWKAEGSGDWDVEVARFFARLDDLDRELAAAGTFDGAVEKLIQGPLADALTHVGQLAMLRGMAGCPVRPESYARAAVTAGRVGPDQAPPGREFDGDASIPR